ncbi:hypothetical protein ACQ4PT_007218 [Festuca glaucescens]
MGINKNPIVFLDVSIADGPDERMIFELFADVAPLTAENFRALCTGEKGIGQTTKKPLYYKGSIFHRVIKGFMAQVSSFLSCVIIYFSTIWFMFVTIFLGNGGESIYGEQFEDENFVLRHDDRGLLSMANAGRNTNGSQFFITFKPNAHLDRKNTVFGKIILGNDVLKRIEHVDVDSSTNMPLAPVRIVDCGELVDGKGRGSVTTENDKKKLKSKLSNISSDDEANEEKQKSRRKKSSKRRKKKRRYSSSESDSSSESESDSESDSDSSSKSSDISSSSDEKRKRRKRHSKKDKRKHGKRKRDRRREKRRRKRDKKSKQKSKRYVRIAKLNISASLLAYNINLITRMEESDSETGNASDSSAEDARKKRHRHGGKSKATSQVSAENHTAVFALKDATSTQEKIATPPRSLAQEDKSQLENGEMRTNGVTNSRSERNPDIVPVLTGNRSKSRSQSMSANHSMSKSMSVSPRSPVKRSYVSLERLASPSPVHPSCSRSPVHAPKQTESRSPPRRRNISTNPHRRSLSKSPPGSASRSPVARRSRARTRSISRSSVRSFQRRSPSKSLERTHVRKSISPSPTPMDKGRSISRTSARSPLQKGVSRSPDMPPRKTASRSPRRNPRRNFSRSPVGLSRRSLTPVRGGRSRRNTSRSPSPPRRAVSPANHDRSPSRSVSPDGSKRIKRGRGFTQRYSFARQYRSPSADRSHRYGGRGDRDRYMSHRGTRYRSPPRRYRSPPRRASPRYRRRSRSVSRSLPVHRDRGRGGGYIRSPVRSRSPPAVRPRSRARSISRSRSLSGSRSRSPPPVQDRSPLASPSPKRASKDRSPSMSISPEGKKGLVSYGDGSPDSAGK